ncbi:hypothetical protein D3C72_1944810 [compost metagenome]
MAKHGIGVVDDLLELVGRDLIAGEAADDGIGDIGIGLAGEGGDLGGVDLGPGLRHIEAAVGSQTSKDRVRETEHRRLAAR